MQEGCNVSDTFHAVMLPLLALVPHAPPFPLLMRSAQPLKYKHTQLQRCALKKKTNCNDLCSIPNLIVDSWDTLPSLFTLFPCDNLGAESALFSSRSDRARVHAW
jgi:hypothetical protein